MKSVNPKKNRFITIFPHYFQVFIAFVWRHPPLHSKLLSPSNRLTQFSHCKPYLAYPPDGFPFLHSTYRIYYLVESRRSRMQSFVHEPGTKSRPRVECIWVEQCLRNGGPSIPFSNKVSVFGFHSDTTKGSAPKPPAKRNKNPIAMGAPFCAYHRLSKMNGKRAVEQILFLGSPSSFGRKRFERKTSNARAKCANTIRAMPFDSKGVWCARQQPSTKSIPIKKTFVPQMTELYTK